jgi:hypothetical protein
MSTTIRRDESPCTAIRERLTLFVLQDLDAATQGLIHEHLKACPACREQEVQIRDTIGTLQDALAQKPKNGIATTLTKERRQRVRHAFRRQKLSIWTRVLQSPVMKIAASLMVGYLLVALLMPASQKARSRSLQVRVIEPMAMEELSDSEGPLFERRGDWNGLGANGWGAGSGSDLMLPFTEPEPPPLAMYDNEVMADMPAPPAETASVQPAEFDSVSQIRSPLVMSGVYGSRSPERRGVQAMGAEDYGDYLSSSEDLAIDIVPAPASPTRPGSGRVAAEPARRDQEEMRRQVAREEELALMRSLALEEDRLREMDARDGWWASEAPSSDAVLTTVIDRQEPPEAGIPLGALMAAAGGESAGSMQAPMPASAPVPSPQTAAPVDRPSTDRGYARRRPPAPPRGTGEPWEVQMGRAMESAKRRDQARMSKPVASSRAVDIRDPGSQGAKIEASLPPAPLEVAVGKLPQALDLDIGDGYEIFDGDIASFRAQGKSGVEEPDMREQDGRSNVGRTEGFALAAKGVSSEEKDMISELKKEVETPDVFAPRFQGDGGESVCVGRRGMRFRRFRLMSTRHPTRCRATTCCRGVCRHRKRYARRNS